MIKNALEDTIERLAEQGSTQAKKAAKTAVKQIKQTFSPSKMWEQILGTSSLTSENSNETSEVKRNSNHTPLNFEKLGKKYQDTEAQKTEALRQRLFQLVKSGDEKVLTDKKQKEQEKKRQEAYEAQEKKRKAEEKARQEQVGNIPKGKVRRSIFSHKKVAERQHSEVKPASGKQ